ncbi:MAG: hypothetical protein AAFQ94_02685 [Bacteroidota bacterium]
MTLTNTVFSLFISSKQRLGTTANQRVTIYLLLITLAMLFALKTNAQTNFLNTGHGGVNGFVTWGGAGNLDFRYESNNRMTLTQAGNLSVFGNTLTLSPGAGNATFTVYRGGSDAKYARITNGAAGGGHINIISNASGSTYFGIQNGLSGLATDYGDMIFATGTGGGANAPTEKVRLSTSGNFGIGDTAPNAKLNVVGNIRSSAEAGETNYIALAHAGGAGNAIINTSTNNLEFKMAGANKMTLTSTGNLGVGTLNPVAALHVNGTGQFEGEVRFMTMASARDFKVSTTLASYPDYVFDDNYNLMSLQHVAAFIESNGHLPEVPSATEAAENGINVGDMQKLLLKKIEELTLHMINLEKDYQALKTAYDELKDNH